MNRFLKRQIFIKFLSLSAAVIAVLSVVCIRSQIRLKNTVQELSAARLSAVLSAVSRCEELEKALLAASCCTSAKELSRQACLISAHTAALESGLSFLSQGYGEGVREFCAQACGQAEGLLESLIDEGEYSPQGGEKLTELARYAHSLYETVCGQAECAMNEIEPSSKLEIPDFSGTKAVASYQEEKEGITYEEAVEKASQFLKTEKILMRFIGEDEKSFRFYHGESYVDVSRESGLISRFVTASRTGEPAITKEQAAQRAQEKLEQWGFAPLVCVEIDENSSFCSVVFAPVKGDVLLLTDTVEAEVNTADGEVTFFDAGRYIDAEKNKSLPAGRLSLDVLRALIVPSLRVKEECYALIDCGSGERLTARFICEGEGFEAEIFLNALTGEEEKISITDIFAE